MKEVLDKQKTIRELEKLAKEVLMLKQRREQRRPLLIEFCGSPKSGKSTTITSLNLFLKRNEFKTVVLTERASICPIDNKTHPFFNLWTLSSTIAEIVKYLDIGSDKIDIIIADRGIFDALCWFTWLNKNPNLASPYLDNKTFEDIKRFTLMDMWRDYIDLIYILKVKPETSIKREYANLLTTKRGTIMKENVLAGFNEAVELVMNQCGSNFRNIEIIQTDTDDTDDDPNRVGYRVTSEVLKSLKDLLIEKIGYFPGSLAKKLKYGVNNVSVIKNERIAFDNRDKVEDSDLIQPIPIVVITNNKKTKVLVVKKGVKRTSADSPEREKLLTYIGGHIRIEDLRNDTIETIKQTLHREIQEEIGESITIASHSKKKSHEVSSPFLIYTPDNKVSRKHLAVCYIIEMDLDDKKFKLVSDEFIMKTGTTKSGHILKINEIKKGKDKPENWSRVILNHLFNAKMPLDKTYEVLTIFDDADM